MGFTLTAPTLERRYVRLEPRGHEHAAGPAAAAEEDRGAYTFTWEARLEKVAKA
ncbi:hypothetical protein OG417_51520 [Actinoallomurus sp. NBC_01490]|uniref:hypothetical protein n=1 Tax=Actinoallomurus sp. NBC_01490 TaxID=2903557 RepID=UPI002E358A5A|nr:hypothetical protein [Actinoallomurus sp. NBC_01490]